MSKYRQRGKKIGKLCDVKQEAYGNSYGKAGDILAILYPNGIPAKDFKNALAITRVIDKLFRIATRPDAFGEDPWADIAGYALLGMRE